MGKPPIFMFPGSSYRSNRALSTLSRMLARCLPDHHDPPERTVPFPQPPCVRLQAHPHARHEVVDGVFGPVGIHRQRREPQRQSDDQRPVPVFHQSRVRRLVQLPCDGGHHPVRSPALGGPPRPSQIQTLHERLPVESRWSASAVVHSHERLDVLCRHTLEHLRHLEPLGPSFGAFRSAPHVVFEPVPRFVSVPPQRMPPNVPPHPNPSAVEFHAMALRLYWSRPPHRSIESESGVGAIVLLSHSIQFVNHHAKDRLHVSHRQIDGVAFAEQGNHLGVIPEQPSGM